MNETFVKKKIVDTKSKNVSIRFDILYKVMSFVRAVSKQWLKKKVDRLETTLTLLDVLSGSSLR